QIRKDGFAVANNSRALLVFFMQKVLYTHRQRWRWRNKLPKLTHRGRARVIFVGPARRFGTEEADIPLKAGDEWAADRVASGARYFPAYHPGQADPVPVHVHR